MLSITASFANSLPASKARQHPQEVGRYMRWRRWQDNDTPRRKRRAGWFQRLLTGAGRTSRPRLRVLLSLLVPGVHQILGMGRPICGLLQLPCRFGHCACWGRVTWRRCRHPRTSLPSLGYLAPCFCSHRWLCRLPQGLQHWHLCQMVAFVFTANSARLQRPAGRTQSRWSSSSVL